ncbi:glycogen debranching N-terminal domain-containing protein [Streptomyces sp. CA-111067]|uniref:glycogen debranching N-terminal domain-containing protein n=1 Tax=Streptomyces sp. CA-111067 TaxID=3240046 RepID=UPI003D965C8A
MSHSRQPSLHQLVSVAHAPSVAVSEGDGQMPAGGLTGFYSCDRRVLSRFEIEVAEASATAVGHRRDGAGARVFSSQLRLAGDEAADMSLALERHRRVEGSGLTETVRLHNYGSEPVAVRLVVRAATDLAPMHEVRGGGGRPPVSPKPIPTGCCWAGEQGDYAELSVGTLAQRRIEPDAAALEVLVSAPAGGSGTAVLAVRYRRGTVPAPGQVFEPAQPLAWKAGPETPDPRIGRLREQSVADLAELLLADPLDPRDRFLAAGSPWYFTLFGRDALWSARLLLPVQDQLALGTLRTLARRQGASDVPEAEEAPGKILHEARRETLRLPGMTLPPLYYGTIDATALWVQLLSESRRAGMSDPDFDGLVPALKAAAGWLVERADADGDGFIEYRRSGPGGLVNQGWKDSAEGIRWSDGRIARAPLALCEVQGYGYAAATAAADLLEAAGEPGAERLREWAADLRVRFRRRFWIEDASGPYPAVALDADKRPVDGAASNMAHLLGTGLLDPGESAAVAERLLRPDLDCGYGLRTLSSASRAFNPLSYHCGSVWPHDTAIAVRGLAAEGFHGQAAALAEGVLAAAEHFDYCLPELYTGVDARTGRPPFPYPTACRPQAWSAAAGVVIADYLAAGH